MASVNDVSSESAVSCNAAYTVVAAVKEKDTKTSMWWRSFFRFLVFAYLCGQFTSNLAPRLNRLDLLSVCDDGYQLNMKYEKSHGQAYAHSASITNPNLTRSLHASR